MAAAEAAAADKMRQMRIHLSATNINICFYSYF